jgi:hypothetical protein
MGASLLVALPCLNCIPLTKMAAASVGISPAAEHGVEQSGPGFLNGGRCRRGLRIGHSLPCDDLYDVWRVLTRHLGLWRCKLLHLHFKSPDLSALAGHLVKKICHARLPSR